MMRLVPWLAAALLGLTLCWAGPARAETYRMTYQAAVLGVVEIGAVSFEVTERAGRYAARATVRTSGLARLFDQTNITATSTGALFSGGAAWSSYDLSHAYARKFRRIQMRRAGGSVSAEIAPTYRDMGDPPASPAQQAASLDPLSALFMLGRQVGAARACRGGAIVFDGRQHYSLTLSPRRAGPFRGGGYDGPAIACTLRYRPLAGFKPMSASERAAIPDGELWFAQAPGAAFAAPLRLTVPTPLGDARLDLRSYAVQ